MAESVYVISAIEPGNGVIGDGFPPGIAITSIVGKSFSLDDAANFVLYLHRCMAGGAQPLSINWPIAPAGKHWAIVDDDVPVVTHWYDGLVAPFKAVAAPGCCIWWADPTGTIPESLILTDPVNRLNDNRVMDVWTADGKFFVVYPNPKVSPSAKRLVCLAEQTLQPTAAQLA
jgi:hypothetical protein